MLVVTTVEDTDALRSYVDPDDTVKVVVPVVFQGVLDWLASDERAIGAAAAAAERTAEQLPGETAEAIAGASDVQLAIRDALATFPAEEIVIAVRPDQQEGLIEGAATDSAPTRSFDGVPVRFVVIPDEPR